MKAKAMKLRMLITLHALFKYTDKDHQMNTAKLNEFLRPVGLEFRGGTALSDTVRVLRDFGLDVRGLDRRRAPSGGCPETACFRCLYQSLSF